jgi:hypothetical protein
MLQPAMLDPWDWVKDGRGLEAELAREAVRGHPLFGVTVRAVARRFDQDDVLFAWDAGVAVVHLTWSRETDPRWPSTARYASIEEWMERVMFDDHLYYVGDDQRAFALEFDYAAGFAALAQTLSTDARRKWTRDGEALTTTDGTTRLRITSSLVLHAELVEGSFREPQAPGEDWYPLAVRNVVSSLQQMGATKIRSFSE